MRGTTSATHVSHLHQTRGPGESYSGVILRLAKAP